MHSRPKLHAPATQVPRQDPASTTCPRARSPALRLVRSSTNSRPLRVVPSSTFQHPFRNKTSPLHHLPARSSSCSVVYHTPSASCPCVSFASMSAPAPDSTFFQVRSSTQFCDERSLPRARSLSYALSIVGLYSQCELCDVRLPSQAPVRPSPLPLAPLARRRIDCHGKTDAAYGANCGEIVGELRGELRGRTAG